MEFRETLLILVFRHGISSSAGEHANLKILWGGRPFCRRSLSPLGRALAGCSRRLTKRLQVFVFSWSWGSPSELARHFGVFGHVHLMIKHSPIYLTPQETTSLLSLRSSLTQISFHFHDEFLPPVREDPTSPHKKKRDKRKSKKQLSLQAIPHWLSLCDQNSLGQAFQLSTLETGFLFEGNLNRTLPPSLTRLILNVNFNQSLSQLPLTITHLGVGCLFNQPLDHLINLQHFHIQKRRVSSMNTLGCFSDFAQPLSSLPSSLICIKWSLVMNSLLPLDQLGHRCPGLRKVRLQGDCFLPPAENSTTQSYLLQRWEEKKLGLLFSHPTLRRWRCSELFVILDSKWKTQVTEIFLPANFSSSPSFRNTFQGTIHWPQTLRKLVFHRYSSLWIFSSQNQENEKKINFLWPAGLRTLVLPDQFNQPLHLFQHLSQLQRLRLGISFNHPIQCLPPHLRCLVIARRLPRAPHFPTQDFSNLINFDMCHSSLNTAIISLPLPADLSIILIGQPNSHSLNQNSFRQVKEISRSNCVIYCKQEIVFTSDPG